jgi:tetratricopeptide (TPR) repeat protein
LARRRRVPVRRPGQPQEADARPGAGRVAAALLFVSFLGLAGGIGLAVAFPIAGFFAIDRARAALREDSGRSLAAAAALADGTDPALFATGALANALLAAEHAGSSAERKRAEALLKTTLAFVRNAPEALYARTLLERLGTPDSGLDEDIAKRAEEKSRNPWWLLARGARALAADKAEEALPFLQRAALGDDAPPHGQLVLARHLVATGDVGDARALTERVLRRRPGHVQARIVGILAALIEDAKVETAEERALKLKQLKQRSGKRRDGPPRPGEVPEPSAGPSLAQWHTPQEAEAIARIEAMDDRDGALLALFLEAIAIARGDDELAGRMRARVMTSVAALPAIAAGQIELSLLEGDLGTAEEVLLSVEDKSASEPALLLHQARLSALKLFPEEELQRRASSRREVRADALALPFGALAFDPWAARSGGLPFQPLFDPEAVPEAALLDVVRGGASEAALAGALDVEVQLFKAERALVRGDLAAANEAVARAREKASGDPDVLLLDARVRIRQGDREAARQAIDAAIAVTPDDPHVLLVGARLHYDNEGFIPARKALKKLDALGFKSPTALALLAMLEARSGDPKNAQNLLASAQAIGAQNVDTLAATVLILRDGRDLEAARAAASRLFAVDQLGASDPILRAWQAEAAFRAGEAARAEIVLDDVIEARASLPDAHLFRGIVVTGTDRQGAIASFTEAIRLAPGTAIAAEAQQRRTALGGGTPAPPPAEEPTPGPQKGKPKPPKKKLR